MNKRNKNIIRLLALGFIVNACTPMPAAVRSQRSPAEEFSRKVRGTSQASSSIGFKSHPAPAARGSLRRAQAAPNKASVHMAKDYPDMYYDQAAYGAQNVGYPDQPFAEPRRAPQHAQDGVDVYRSREVRRQHDYNGPLSLGDPGVGASLWQESRSGNDLFRDYRAFKPMDLITIVVTENSEGRKEADTEVIEQVDILAGITNLFNFENDVQASNSGLDTASLVRANSANQFIGEGETTRRDTLTARISAMVVEVLPSGVMRIEGEKIISVNNEEQIMVISGLVRTRDVSSINEVDSSKIANLRVDYYGQGVIGDVQSTGWFTRLMSKVWPF